MFDPVSPQAGAIASLFVAVLGICAVIFLVVIAIIGYALLRSWRERRAGSEPVEDARDREQVWLEVLWTAVPLAIVAVILGMSIKVARTADPTPAGPVDIVIRGHQWWWEVSYPTLGFATANELHLPVGKRVHLVLESADVVHDFWVPELSRKIDLIPGVQNHLSFEVQRSGRFEGACAEFCGAQHAWMRLQVFAHARDEYAAWGREQTRPADPPVESNARAGLSLYERETCNRCHTIRGQDPASRESPEIGPDLTHVASRRLLGAGVIINDTQHLTEWLLNPQAIKEGSHMPNFQLVADEAAQLSAYLTGLK